jgi:hypothetical protein
MAWESFMIPELTKPTLRTEMAVELWTTAVRKMPARKAFQSFPVNLSRILFIISPDILSRPSPIMSTPYMRRAVPPRIPKMN